MLSLGWVVADRCRARALLVRRPASLRTSVSLAALGGVGVVSFLTLAHAARAHGTELRGRGDLPPSQDRGGHQAESDDAREHGCS